MTASFTLEIWQERVAAWWRETGRDAPAAMARLGVQTAYGLLTASAFLPLLEAYRQHPGPALTTLVGLVGGVGSNLVANVVQGAYDRATASRQIEREIAENPGLRAEYEALLGKLDVLGTAQHALGAQWAGFETQLQADLAAQHLALKIESGGGAVILGNVSVTNGNFIGRDQVNINLDPEKAAREELLCAYYRALASNCRHLQLGTFDPKFIRSTATGQVTLHQVYVGLDVAAPVRGEDEDSQAWGLRLARGEGQGRTPLLKALAEPEAAHAVLLGDPGSGKTTFVNYLTYRLAEVAAGNGSPDDLPEALRDLWPMRLILREAARYLPPDAHGTADMLWKAVHADLTQRLGEVAAERLLPYLQARLVRRGFFLLDGLDEVPAAHRRRECLLEAIQSLLGTLQPGGRVLLTARPYAYADPEWQLPGLPILALAPFNEEQVSRFVARWYQAVGPVMSWGPEESQGRGEQLSTALQERPRLGDLASRPLLLTLMTTLHTSWGQLPEDRAELYEESVKLLLSRWQRARTVRMPEGEEEQPGITAKLDTELHPLRRALEQLAYAAHARQGEAAERDDAPAGIPEQEVLAALCQVLPQDVNATAVLPYLKYRAGLLLERRPGVYAFPHRSFQEYLAACHLAETEKDFGGRLRELIWDDATWWREVFLLGVGKAQQGGLSNAVAVVNTLVHSELIDVVEPTTTHWYAAALAGTALLDLDLAGQLDAPPHHRALLRRVRRWLVALVEAGHLSPRERLEAGDVLGRLGDPRPGVGTVPLGGAGSEIPDILWVKIPAGPFLMGSVDDDAEAYPDEKTQHKLTLPDYYIARYPVTNAQFRPFVEGDGYENPDYWTKQGWAWRQGAEPDLSPWDDYSDEDFKRRSREWLAGRPVEKRDRHFWWNDSRWGAPTRPVVGVTWFEAVAYTRWLEERLKVASFKLKVWQDKKIVNVNLQRATFNLQLPSEAEWEKAARGGLPSPERRGVGGEVQKYPWGNDWQENCANIETVGLEQTNPVGMFPAGASPYGVLEMSGNVWEWTRSRWGERSVMQVEYGYPYNSADGREQLEGMKILILRGGSWYNDLRNARCAFRPGNLPDFFGYDSGLRMVVSLVRC